jgi:hypothetical protein
MRAVQIEEVRGGGGWIDFEASAQIDAGGKSCIRWESVPHSN